MKETNQKYNHSMKSKRASRYLLIVGMVFLVIGLATNQTVFSWLAVACVLISLVTGGRWLRPRR